MNSATLGGILVAILIPLISVASTQELKPYYKHGVSNRWTCKSSKIYFDTTPITEYAGGELIANMCNCHEEDRDKAAYYYYQCYGAAVSNYLGISRVADWENCQRQAFGSAFDSLLDVQELLCNRNITRDDAEIEMKNYRECLDTVYSDKDARIKDTIVIHICQADSLGLNTKEIVPQRINTDVIYGTGVRGWIARKLF